MVRHTQFVFRLLASFILLVSLSGCNFFRPYSPVQAFETRPENLGTILPMLEARWPAVATYQAQGEMALSGEGVLGTAGFGSNVLYESPAKIRIRASRGPLTVLEVLQTGPGVAIVNNREQQVFIGSVDQLVEHPGVIGGIEPLEVARALLIGQTFVEAVGAAQSAGEEPAALAFEDDELLFSKTFRPAGAQGPRRLEEYIVRQRDGLIEGARLVQALPSGQLVELVVEYKHWGVTGDGRPYPRELVIHSKNPQTRLKVKVDQPVIDREFSPQVFYLDPGQYQMFPLESLLEADLE